MMVLEEHHPSSTREYLSGNQGKLCVIGLREDPAALRRCMVEGPEVNPLLAACEAMSSSIDTRIDRRHHEATVGAQTALFENVKS